MSNGPMCLHNGYHRPGECPEANEAARVRSEAHFYANLVLRRGDAMEPVAHVTSGDRVIGAVHIGRLDIQSCEPEALIELAEALRAAAARMEALRAGPDQRQGATNE